MAIRHLILLSFIFLAVVSCGGGLCGVNGEGCSSVPPSVGSASSVDTGDGTGRVTVTITGTGFVNGMTVTVNGNDCTNVTVITSTQATCILPNGQIALVNIIITAPNGSSGGSSLSSPLVASTATSASATPVVGGSQPWVNIGNVLSTDSLVATNTDTSGMPSETLFIKGYFSSAAYALPSSAIIDGIIAKCRWSSTWAAATNTSIRLAKAGVQVGNNKANGSPLPVTLTYSSDYGGSGDLWGETWTPSQINHPEFGIVLSFNEENVVHSVDNCQLSVYWH